VCFLLVDESESEYSEAAQIFAQGLIFNPIFLVCYCMVYSRLFKTNYVSRSHNKQSLKCFFFCIMQHIIIGIFGSILFGITIF
jgi:hypothetical protein